MPVSGFLANRYEIVQRIVNAPGGDYRVIAASPLDEVRTSVQALASNLWLGIPLLVVLVGLVTWWLVGRALHPVERMRQEVEEISHTTLAPARRRARHGRRGGPPRPHHERHARPARGGPDDAAPVRVRRLPRAAEPAGDDQDERRGGPAPPPGRRLARRGDDGARTRASASTSWWPTCWRWPRSTRRAATDAPRARGVVDLDEVVLADVARHRSLGHAVRAEGVSAARVEGDAVQLQRLVRNLLDNAARHATSVVTVTLGEAAGDAVLRGRRRRSRHSRRRPRAGVRALRPPRRRAGRAPRAVRASGCRWSRPSP